MDKTMLSTTIGSVPKAVCTLIVDYTMSFEEMVVAGKYDWVNSDITAKRFSITGSDKGENEFKLLGFDYPVSSENAIKRIEEEDKCNPWSPAAIEHLLAFGAKHPNEQREYPIIGLGSVAEINGARRVACLYEGDSKRDFYLSWWGSGWNSRCRFLVVRGVKKS